MTSKNKAYCVLGLSLVLVLAWSLLRTGEDSRQELKKTITISQQTELAKKNTADLSESETSKELILPADVDSTTAQVEPTAAEKEQALHQSGIPHDCLESMRIGAESADVKLSEEQIQSLLQETRDADEKLVEEFENYIVSEDGQTIFDRQAITEDFMKEVEKTEKAAASDVEVTRIDEI